jgi:hypothetical protein
MSSGELSKELAQWQVADNTMITAKFVHYRTEVLA